MLMSEYIGVLTLCLLAKSNGQKLVGVPAPDYRCPEPNGKFPDPEQCDKFYICRKNEAEEVLCPEGLLFDYTIPNREKCVLPHNVKCGDRLLVQTRTPDIDPRCEAANGIFNFDDPKVCDRYLNCDKGTAFEMPCPNPLMFDVAIGGCVRSEQLSEFAKRCDEDQEFQEIDGFRCPGGETIGPQGLLQQHPIFRHPSDCQFYFTCYFGKEPNKFGCSTGEVFDPEKQQCTSPDKVFDCKCWYDCGEDSKCPGTCNSDCSCPSK